MQRFTLLHDGTDEGWRAAYLAFHLSARLGAPLLALMVEPGIDTEMISQKANEVEVGGRAAGLVIKTKLIADFSAEVVADSAVRSNGLIVPRKLVLDKTTAERFLAALECPLWIVSKESEINNLAVLVDDPAADKNLIDHAVSQSRRLQENLAGFVRPTASTVLSQLYAPVSWNELSDFAADTIASALDRLHINVLFLSLTSLSLVKELQINCVVYSF